ncbi:MAG: copper resistance protein CopB [Rhizobiales bacterium NRL2]|jgi:copper resistance protein B|nr:MAG: copper resistance protein CopB [Rhizobiales bacterium NRL2]
MIKNGIWHRPLLAVAAATLLLTGAQMAQAQVADEEVFTFLQVERFEYRATDGKDLLNWEAQGWAGTDTNKAWLKTEGEKLVGGKVEDAEVQLLYSRMIAPFWDLQVGARYDIRPDPSRGFAVFGVQGFAPYFFEVDAAGFVSEDGDVSARIEAEYELLLTQRLILQPSAELNFAVQEVERLGIGRGLSDVELGLRLRYEIVREFAPYVGVSWERKVGRTADFARREGEDVDSLALVAGVRFWF